MKKRLPVHLDNYELPVDKYRRQSVNASYGFASILYLISIIVTAFSVLTVMVIGK